MRLLNEARNIKDPVFKLSERFKKHLNLIAIYIDNEDNALSFRYIVLDELPKKKKLWM